MSAFSKTRFLAWEWMLLFLAGCGGDGLATLTGRVTYDGRPIEQGAITFFPIDGAGRTAAAAIRNGVYRVRIAPGRKSVQIEGFRVIGQHHYLRTDPTSALVDDLEQTLPAKYNTKTALQLDLKPSVATHDFLLGK